MTGAPVAGAGGSPHTASDEAVWPPLDPQSYSERCYLARMWKRVFCFRVRVEVDGLLGILVNEVSLFLGQM